jgi:hypothetical protein
MAFMGKAQFPGFGPHGEQLDRGMKWLLKEAKKRPDGYLGTVMYEHGLATLALSEMWGMVRDPEDDDAIKEALEKASEVILRSQNPSGGWRYQPQADAGQDTSCTMTVFHALASAHQAGIVVPNATIAKVVKYLEGVYDRQTGVFSYTGGSKAKSPACTAGGAYIAQLAGQRDTEMVNAAIRYLKSQAPGIFTGGGVLLLRPLLCDPGDGAGRRRGILRVVSQDPGCAGQTAECPRRLGRGQQSRHHFLRDADGHHYPGHPPSLHPDLPKMI